MKANIGAIEGELRVAKGAWLALTLLAIANMFNYLDRKIISILAEAIKADLKVEDQHIGFLYGTVFAALYAIFGMPIGRLSDRWSRTKLMSLGLALWSGMTALSGMATSFVTMASARVGVALGESVANPCSNSMIAEYFPPHRRAMAFGIYLAAMFVGTGGALILGGAILQHWDAFAASTGIGQMFRPWQAAFLICGLPGLILAALIARMPDPPQAIARPGEVGAVANPWRTLLTDIALVIPPTSFLYMARLSPRALNANIAAALFITALVAGLTALTGDLQQWLALGLACYAVMSFCQSLLVRDRGLFDLTLGSRAFQLIIGGMAIVACINNAALFWVTPHMMRTFNISVAQGGLIVGLLVGALSALGVVGGGLVADRLRRQSVRLPLWLPIVALLGAMPFCFIMLLTRDVTIFFVALALFVTLQGSWSPMAAAIVQDLILPRMRATGAATSAMLLTITSFAVGPYLAGKIGTLTGSIATGVFSLYAMAPVGLVLLLAAMPRLSVALQRRDALQAAEMAAPCATIDPNAAERRKPKHLRQV